MSSQSRSISILSWNVRGLGEPDKCKLVSATISSVRPVLIMLQETKLANIDALKARSFLPAFLDCYHFIGSYGSRGALSPLGIVQFSLKLPLFLATIP